MHRLGDLTRYKKAIAWAAGLAGDHLAAAYRRRDYETERRWHDVVNSFASLGHEIALEERRREWVTEGEKIPSELVDDFLMWYAERHPGRQLPSRIVVQAIMATVMEGEEHHNGVVEKREDR